MRATLGFGTIALVAATIAAAQTIPNAPAGVGYGALGYGGGYGFGHASTAEEGIQRGYADVVRSEGMANLLNSAAAINYEDARKAYLDNRLKATQTYFEMRRYNTEARRAEKASPLSMEGYVRLARQQAPAQLSASQLDPLTGMIGWPVQLKQPEYAALRSAIEKQFHNRSAGVPDFVAIDKACDTLDAQVKADIAKFQANDFIAAKNFVASLKYAAHSPI